MEPHIYVSRNLSIDEQIRLESMFDEFTELGLYEKTVNPITLEPVYIPIEDITQNQQS